MDKLIVVMIIALVAASVLLMIKCGELEDEDDE